MTLRNGATLLVLNGYTFSKNSRIRKGGHRFMCSNAFSRGCPAFVHVNAQHIIIHAVTDHTHPPPMYYKSISEDIPETLVYQEYSFTRNRFLTDGKIELKDELYRCSNADSDSCKAYLLVNLTGDVLSAYSEHNHMPNKEEKICKETMKTKFNRYFGTKSRCTKRQICYLLEYMLQNRDLAVGVKERSLAARNKIYKKWQTLASELNEIGPPKSIERIKATWKDLKQSSRSELTNLSKQPNSMTCIPSEKTCKVYAALGHPIDTTKKIGPEDLVDLLIASATNPNEKVLIGLMERKAALNQGNSSFVKQSSYAFCSDRSPCTTRQITFLIDYMVQNRGLALRTLDCSLTIQKWQELESKMAEIGPKKSIGHLIQTWSEIQEDARKKIMVATDKEQLSANTMKVINLLGLAENLAPRETSAGHNENDDQSTHVAPTSFAAEEKECSEYESDSSANWSRYEIDSYP